MEYYKKLDQVRELVPEAAILEQMAEECSELSQMLLKKARKLRGENYTPKTLDEIQTKLIEEFTDVVLCSEVLNFEYDSNILKSKLERWIFRNTYRKEL